jgi:hypothetical protein
LDPIAKIPELKVCAARLEKAVRPYRKPDLTSAPVS